MPMFSKINSILNNFGKSCVQRNLNGCEQFSKSEIFPFKTDGSNLKLEVPKKMEENCNSEFV
jgi:hypothetical protein